MAASSLHGTPGLIEQMPVVEEALASDPYQAVTFDPYQEELAADICQQTPLAQGSGALQQPSVAPTPPTLEAAGCTSLCQSESALVANQVRSSLIVTGPRFKFPSKLKQMRVMGFRQEETFLRSLLTKATGLVESAVADICSPKPPPPRLALAPPSPPAAACGVPEKASPRQPGPEHHGIVGGEGRRASIGGA